ncbi:tRNA-dihydrouridine synthase [Candidatus Nomurabacteria bacterium]|nr:MAG: tRNA-dihydrouridine synthase [Candidatus Nomurabacteria bacterium]
MASFWNSLPKPFFALAPMADVTDAAFRSIIAKYSNHGTPDGGPDVFWTEFVSADGLMSQGREVLKRDLIFSDNERPIVAQLFGSNPEVMEGAARLCMELGFDGIDINMGCPDKSIEKQGSGAAMIQNPEQAKAVIVAAKRGAPTLPVSVKTRVGYNKVILDDWLPQLLRCDLAAITVHARTRKEMSSVPARWEHVKEAVEIRNAIGAETLIIGNGDVKNIEDAKQKAFETNCDGVMLGRAIFGNPWLFAQSRNNQDSVQGILLEERLLVMVEHTKLFEELLGDIKSFAIMKKHFKSYIGSFEGAKEFRMQLMDEAKNSHDVEKIVDNFLAVHKNLL